jgi:uncharacterized protein YjaZ
VKGVHWIEPGQWPVHMALIADEKVYRRFMRVYCGPEEAPHEFPRLNAGHCQQMNDRAGNMMLVIVVGRQSNRSELAVTLAHEATHAMRWLMEYVGEHSPGTESEAYLVGHIVRQSLAALTKR